MMTRIVECQNNQCKFHTTGKDKGKNRRKRI